jgi:hypothetical protein
MPRPDIPPRPAEEPQLKLADSARTVLARRYLRKDDQGQVCETPEDMFWRVAWTIAYTYAKTLPHRADFTGWTAVPGRGEFRMSLAAVQEICTTLDLVPGNCSETIPVTVLIPAGGCRASCRSRQRFP